MSKNDSRLYSYYFDRFGLSLYDFNDKERCQRNYVTYMLNRMQRLFEYQGLPDTIPQRMLEMMLQINGFACFAKHNGKLYAFWGGLGGEPDEYYRPTKCVVSNPALKFSDTFEIGKDCVIVRNDSFLYGLIPLFSRYATAMVENDISFRMASINTRIEALLSAPDDATKKAAEKYLEDVEKGKLGVIAENAFLDGIKAQEVGRTMRTFTDLIEYQQYLKASWFNEIGLNANYNMKREKLSTTESQMNNDALLPLVEDMLENRRKCLEEVNAMFGTDISVEFASSWEKLIEEMEAESNQLDGEGVMDNGTDVSTGETQWENGTSENVGEERTGTETVGRSDMANVRDPEEQRPDSDDDAGTAQGDERSADTSDDSVESGQMQMEDSDAGVEVNVEVEVSVDGESDEPDGSIQDNESDEVRDNQGDL